MARTKRIPLQVTLLEKRQVDREAKEAGMNAADYVRSKLGLSLARGKRNNYEKAPDPPLGDPDNAVDVEELAKEIFGDGLTMVQARREAKRRLMGAKH